MNETWWVNASDLDKQQLLLVTAAPEKEMLILGPPGSGKTNILMLRGNYMKSIAPRTIVFTFTRTLCEFLRSGPNVGRADQIQQNEITTFMSWGRSLLKNNGFQIPEKTESFQQDREYVAEAVITLVNEKRTGHLYDLALIDEVQDFMKLEIEAIRTVSRRMAAAGDSRQRIFEGREGIPAAISAVQEVVELRRHYRIGRRVCELADQILPPQSGEPPLVDGCNYPEAIRESLVDSVQSENIDEQFNECIKRIRDQRRYITDEPIGVLFRSNEHLNAFWRRLQDETDLSKVSILQRANERQNFSPDRLIQVMTIHSAKGLEFRAIHLPDSESFSSFNRELAFTGVTRAKTEVIMYHTLTLPGHMRLAKNELPPVDSIF